MSGRKLIAKTIVTCGSDLDAEHEVVMPRSLRGSSMAGTPSQLFNPPFVQSLQFHPDGQYLATGGGDGSVHIYRFPYNRVMCVDDVGSH